MIFAFVVNKCTLSGRRGYKMAINSKSSNRNGIRSFGYLNEGKNLEEWRDEMAAGD